MPRRHAGLTRLLVDADLTPGAALTLSRDQSHYLVAVLRLAPGDELVVFNGRQGAWRARIAAAGKRQAELALVEQIARQPPPADLYFGFAPLKAGRLDYLVQKATEMGAGVIQPVLTQFTQLRHLKPEKLAANIVEAAEQCEVLGVPELLPATTIEALLADWPVRHPGRRLVFADETAPAASPLPTLAPLAGQPLGLIVGPEGGFSDAERALLGACDFVVPISLGPRILRADTAAVAALAVVQASIGDWR